MYCDKAAAPQETWGSSTLPQDMVVLVEHPIFLIVDTGREVH